ncbi:Uncharacterised protein (plasmid) [Tsukamurella tyrosinosolvens]|nr:Uncharacterised protein [Tsukamurella tyrosinosolvens]
MHDAVAALHVDGADGLGRELPEPAAGDHCGPAHPEVGVRGGDDDVADAGERRVAREAPAGDDGEERHPPPQRAERPEGGHVEARHDVEVGVAGAAAAALREQHDRHPAALRDVDQAVGLGVVAPSLRPGEHGVVVRDHHRLGAVDRREPADESVRGARRDELLLGAARSLRGQEQRAVLGEAARVHEVVDVLAGGAPADPPPLGDGVGPALIEGDAVPLAHLVEIRAGPVEIEGISRIAGGRRAVGGGVRQERGTRGHRLPGPHQHVADGDAHRQRLLVLHLHGLEHHEGGPGLGRGPGSRDRDDGAGQRRGEHVPVELDGGRRCGDRGLGHEVPDPAREVPGVDGARPEFGIGEDGAEQGEVGAGAVDHELPQRRIGLGVGARRGGGAHDHLREQRVVPCGGRQAGAAVVVDADAGPGRRGVAEQGAGSREHGAVALRHFEVDAGLHGGPVGSGGRPRDDAVAAADGGRQAEVAQRRPLGE